MVNMNNYLDPLDVLGEKNFNEPREVDESEIGSPVQEFFRGAVVFITGGTGFLGKVLIEKLLRTCPHIKHIYLLIRNKKNKTAEQRLAQIFNDRLFKRLKYEVPSYYHKVTAMSGDCALPGLGLSENDRNTLIDEVNIIFHGAATVRFNEHIRVAVNINVSGTREVVRLARQITNLKVVAHVSTAYSNCNRFHIEEKFYDPIADYKEILNLVSSKDDQTLQDMTRGIIGCLPNTYSFTKSLGEDVIRREGQGLPICMYRPTIVLNTYREPVRGWTDNFYGPTGIIVGGSLGIIHTYIADPNIVPDIIPVDICVNGLICATVETATKKTCSEIPIYTCSSSRQNPITTADFIERTRRHGFYWASIKAIWYYAVIGTSSPFIYKILNFLLHMIPGYLLDSLAVLRGHEFRLLNVYKKINQVSDILSYFVFQQWTFDNDSMVAVWNALDPQDKILFNFDINQICWEYFCQANYLGIRVYVLNDDVDTLPEARKKFKKLKMLHYTTLTFLFIVFLVCTWSILCILLKVWGFETRA